MPRLIEADCTERIELGDLIETLETRDVDARDEDGFAAFGSDLKKLANNRDFLADIVVDELKRRCRHQTDTNAYGPQVVLLHRARNFFIRANFWPSEEDGVLQDNGTAPFFYHVPHDHNFSFLTVGYMGPGYWSDYYEYDYRSVRGVPDEPVDLRFTGRSRLAEGKVMLYRAHRDVHAQLPADALSVSINIMEQSRTLPYRDQYRFDVGKGTIAGVLTLAPVEPLLALCARLGGGNARDLLSDYAAFHPCDRIQFGAVRALASAEPDVGDRLAAYERSARSGNAFVAGMAALEIATIQSGRSWIEQRPH